MKIRSITLGQNVPFFEDKNTFKSFLEEKCAPLSNFAKDLIEEFKKQDIEVQTTRICTQPILSNNISLKNQKVIDENFPILEKQLYMLKETCETFKFDCFSSCLMLADKYNEIKHLEKFMTQDFPNLINNIRIFFSSLVVSSTLNGVNLTALKYGAKIIKKLSEDPFYNLKFCISSNVKADTPFYPASYHLSESSKFSLALEMADEVLDVIKETSTFSDAQTNLKIMFDETYGKINSIAENIGNKHEIEFHGMDLSPAPYPTVEISIGTAVENLGFDYFGAPGSLIAVALIKNAIPKKEKVIGFSGFMQPVLEDITIAKRCAENKINLETLLLNSTICGTGLDCVPLPGNITERELFYILLDSVTISITHDKPLTARLMPIPRKNAGDDVELDFEYVVSSKVMNLRRLTDDQGNDLFNRNESFINLIKK